MSIQVVDQRAADLAESNAALGSQASDELGLITDSASVADDSAELVTDQDPGSEHYLGAQQRYYDSVHAIKEAVRLLCLKCNDQHAS